MQDLEKLAQIQTDRELDLFQRLKSREVELRKALATLGTTKFQGIPDIQSARQNLVWQNWAAQKSQELNIHLAQCLAAQETQRETAMKSWCRNQAIVAQIASDKKRFTKKSAAQMQDRAIATVIINPDARYR